MNEDNKDVIAEIREHLRIAQTLLASIDPAAVPIPGANEVFEDDPRLEETLAHYSGKEFEGLILNTLHSAGINRMRDLVTKHPSELRRIRQVGKTTISRLEKILASRGLRWGMKIVPRPPHAPE